MKLFPVVVVAVVAGSWSLVECAVVAADSEPSFYPKEVDEEEAEVLDDFTLPEDAHFWRQPLNLKILLASILPACVYSNEQYKPETEPAFRADRTGATQPAFDRLFPAELLKACANPDEQFNDEMCDHIRSFVERSDLAKAMVLVHLFDAGRRAGLDEAGASRLAVNVLGHPEPSSHESDHHPYHHTPILPHGRSE